MHMPNPPHPFLIVIIKVSINCFIQYLSWAAKGSAYKTRARSSFNSARNVSSYSSDIMAWDLLNSDCRDAHRAHCEQLSTVRHYLAGGLHTCDTKCLRSPREVKRCENALRMTSCWSSLLRQTSTACKQLQASFLSPPAGCYRHKSIR